MLVYHDCGYIEKGIAVPKSHADEFWDYGVRCFADSSFAARCIELQDEYGTDTNVILLHLWGRMAGGAVIWHAIYDLAEEWQAERLRPLREARRALKDLDDALYNKIRRVELQLERMEQAALIDRFIELGGDIKDGAASDLEVYLKHCGVEEEYEHLISLKMVKL